MIILTPSVVQVMLCIFYFEFYLPATRGSSVLPVTEVGDVGDEPVVDLVESQSLVWGGEDGLQARLSVRQIFPGRDWPYWTCSIKSE